MDDANSENDTGEPQDEDVEISRRKFLKWASYVPPAIAGLMVSSTPAAAATCNPNACNPNCNPNADCNPDKTCGPDGCNPDEPCNPPGR